MRQLLLCSAQVTPFFNSFHRPVNILKLPPQRLCPHFSKGAEFREKFFIWLRLSMRGSFLAEVYAGNATRNKTLTCAGDNLLGNLPYVQTLRTFPKEELLNKVVLVRFDSALLLQEQHDWRNQSFSNAVFTIRYLLEARARILLVSDWNEKIYSRFLDLESVAEHLSAVLNFKVKPETCIPFNMECYEKTNAIVYENLLKFKGEVGNSSKLAELLSSGVDIFVNDSFSQSHKMLASTVGITRFCYASLAGFHFEQSLYRLRNASDTCRQPYIAIIGGSNLCIKAPALRFLASICDGLVFVGMMSFTIMHALGFSVPLNMVEKGALKGAIDLIHVAKDRGIPILCPKDFWCTNEQLSRQVEIFPAHRIPEGWAPVDVGPSSLDEIGSLLTKCKKLIWIGPVTFKSFSQCIDGVSEVARMINKRCAIDCDVTIVGSTACETIMEGSRSFASLHVIENASVFWEFLEGRKLPGILALDRAYPFMINWMSIFGKPAQPLIVDIGSGNGLFLLEMGKKRKDLNFLGLEMNEKLVRRCLLSLHQFQLENGHFIATNATSTFRSIVSTYPGEVVLVSIQVWREG
ncbi:hypothetical protein SAY86_031153 [Trapa natans]|uniref:Phosphoglycerate kinase n=1 Tax=Trapa natans TaxID=22666 RepID=A0AAN7RD95_TRANT|nr:hypothetical protein SAY86_031153 [Trapa natans]